jgi:ubiquinone/menaquinone biosynthesis C-methylase UbiE
MPGRGAERVPIVQGPAKAMRFFDRLAPWYDRINARIYRREWLDRVRSEFRGTRILDVGVGTGFTTGNVTTAVGIDLSAEMLSRARYRGDLIRADFMRPPFRSESFDTVVFAGSFYYLPDPTAGARTAAGLLRPAGRVVLLSPATPLLAPLVRVYRPDEYRRILEGAGLRFLRYEPLNWAACLVLAEKGAA